MSGLVLPDAQAREFRPELGVETRCPSARQTLNAEAASKDDLHGTRVGGWIASGSCSLARNHAYSSSLGMTISS